VVRCSDLKTAGSRGRERLRLADVRKTMRDSFIHRHPTDPVHISTHRSRSVRAMRPSSRTVFGPV
jgi:hypothetical protein